MNYGEILKNLRIKNNLKQEDIANILNIARITYSHYECMEKIIPLERLNDICNYYKITFDYVMGLNKDNNFICNSSINRCKAGKRLKEFRKENKLTQKELAKFLNTSQSVIATYENGTFLLSTSFLYAICKKYKISADYLLGKID